MVLCRFTLEAVETWAVALRVMGVSILWWQRAERAAVFAALGHSPLTCFSPVSYFTKHFVNEFIHHQRRTREISVSTSLDLFFFSVSLPEWQLEAVRSFACVCWCFSLWLANLSSGLSISPSDRQHEYERTPSLRFKITGDHTTTLFLLDLNYRFWHNYSGGAITNPNTDYGEGQCIIYCVGDLVPSLSIFKKKISSHPFISISFSLPLRKPLSSLYTEGAMNLLAQCHHNPFTSAQHDRTAATISQSVHPVFPAAPTCTVKWQNGHFTDSPPPLFTTPCLHETLTEMARVCARLCVGLCAHGYSTR